MDTSVSKSSDRLSYQPTMLVSSPSIHSLVPVSFVLGDLVVVALYLNINCLYCNSHFSSFLCRELFFTRP